MDGKRKTYCLLLDWLLLDDAPVHDPHLPICRSARPAPIPPTLSSVPPIQDKPNN